MYIIKPYENLWQKDLLEFLKKCMPESNRCLDISGHHYLYCDIKKQFENFCCMFDNENIIGTVGIKKISSSECELKSFYIYKKYYGKNLGYNLIMQAVLYAKENKYKKIYTLKTSERTINLYKKIGFNLIERYNENVNADVFMKLDLDN